MRKYIVGIIIMILSITLILSGCSKGETTTSDNNLENEDSVNKDLENKEEEKIKDNDDIVDNNKDNDKSNKKEIIDGIKSPLSGIIANEKKVLRRPVAIMYDNHPRARWQAGLGQAEIVYEFRVEYPYTRYMAIFLINDPKHIGPIRSSRPYFVTTLLQYDPIYVRVGGSEAAKAYIKKLKIADIDGLTSSSSVFWRYYDTGKKAPNNLYSSMKAIRNTQKERGYRLTGDYEGFIFNDIDSEIDGETAETVLIKYNKENSTKYEYDKDNEVYKRYKDGKLHIDEFDGSLITAKNIIIQRADTKSIDSVGRLSIELISKGSGMYITNGKVIDITWEKTSERSKTFYYDNEGNEILLNPGVTWIQVVPQNTSITVK